MGGLGAAGSGLTTLQQVAASTSPGGKAATTWWGYDVTGTVLVQDQTTFNAAVALLRTPAGRPTGDPSAYVPPAGWLYGPAYATVAANMATIDTSVASAEMTGTCSGTVDTLAKLDISVLAVEFLTWCARSRARAAPLRTHQQHGHAF
jgi:hypothetical protein